MSALTAATTTSDQTIRTLSHSQVETFSQCPRRWSLEKIERVPRAPSEHLLFGTAVHAAIEADGRRLQAGEAPLPLAALVAAFADGLTTEAVNADPLGLLDALHDTLRLRGLAVLRAYSERVQPHYRPVEVESAFELPIPAGPDTVRQDWAFTGRIDALTVRNGVRTIVDFKTASKRWLPGAEHAKDQASAYLWADATDCIAEAGEPQPERGVTFITLPTFETTDGGYTCVVDVRTTQRTPDDIDTYVARVGQVADRMTRVMRLGQATTKTGPLCGWCSCLGVCDEGRAWLRSHGRRPMVPLLSRDGEVIA